MQANRREREDQVSTIETSPGESPTIAGSAAAGATGVDTDTGRRILVVDDEPNIVEVITMALRFQGFEVEQRRPAAARRWPR